MLTRFARLPLRRCLHSRAIPKPQSHRRTIAFGVSAAATTYLTWRLASDDYRIALDSPQAGHISGSETASPTSATSEGASLKAGTSSSSSPEEVASALPSASTGGDFGPESTSTLEEGQENPSESNENGSNGGAFNPETGEINWDCPCLGGMAYGPCGPQFREAFSCFVYSEAEPKGMDCVEKFKAMQDCFRAHPDVYADEIGDDEEESLSTSGGEPSNVTDIEDDKLLPIQAQAEISSNDTPGSPSSTASS